MSAEGTTVSDMATVSSGPIITKVDTGKMGKYFSDEYKFLFRIILVDSKTKYTKYSLFKQPGKQLNNKVKQLIGVETMDPWAQLLILCHHYWCLGCMKQ